MLIDVLSTPFDALLPRLRPACRSTRSSLRALNPPLVRTSRGHGLLNAVVINEEYAQDFCAGAGNQLGTRTLGTPLLNWKISEIKYSTSGCTSMCSRTALTTTTTTQAPGVAVMKASSRRQRWEHSVVSSNPLMRSDLLSEFYGGQGLGVGILSSGPLPRINMPRLAAAHYIPSDRLALHWAYFYIRGFHLQFSALLLLLLLLPLPSPSFISADSSSSRPS
ncbi:hypothetical protein B0H11DRAFT_2230028 [Mycena galericulata]|nr:hypothetical protein B0H11DRAFT_2230028 [Mycena galericulata]